MPGFKIAVGLVLLFAGCQIPWFFSGVAGLLVGDFIGLYIQNIEDTWELFINDLKYGLLGALLSFLHRRTISILAGGLHGAFLIRNLPLFLDLNMEWFSWQYYVIAIAIGILLVYFLNTFAILVISSFSGAVLVSQNSEFGSVSPLFSLIILVFLGVATQFILLRHYNPSQDEPAT
ncbi:MAG: hypothetical protein JW908_13535 [Anaerolineales bacterium]|nr:hypothetical protein [Anaerolineales bacterium]